MSNNPTHPKENDRVLVSIQGEKPFTALVEYASEKSLLLNVPPAIFISLFRTAPGAWETRERLPATVEVLD